MEPKLGVPETWVSGAVEERSKGDEAIPEGVVERLEVNMPERVAIKQVRILFVESLRFPGEGKSARG